MCGILFGRRSDNHPMGKTILKRYHKQRERGHEGFGFITIDKDRISGVHRFELESEALSALADSKSSCILFHHRLPTSTPNYKDVTHPILVKNKILDKNYYVVHNGVLQNEDTLKPMHEAMGFVYTTVVRETKIIQTATNKTEYVTEMFNDSESLAIEVALYLDGKKKTIDAIGTIAFVCVETDKKDNVLKIHYGRNTGNPLVVEDNNDLFFLKSVGEGIKVDEDEIITLDYKTGAQTIQQVDVGSRFQVQRVQQRTIGFGERDEDEFVASPDDYWPENGRQRLLAAQKEEYVSAESAEMYDNIEWQDAYESYRLTDEYLLELWSEIESIQTDITECRLKLRGVLSHEDIIYNEEYLNECCSVLSDKQGEADTLERYLELKKTNESIV